MINARLLKSQKNEFLKLIINNRLNPNEFEWKDAKYQFSEEGFSYHISTLEHREPGYFFMFVNDSDYWFPEYSPAATTHLYSCNMPVVYENVLECFSEWLIFLSREILAPDLWADIEKYRVTGEILYDEENPNSLFTEEQLGKITYGMEQIRTYLLQEYQNKAETELINEKLDYLIDAAKKQGRVDWKNIFVGTIINIGTSLAMSSEQFSHIKTIFSVAWNTFIKFIGS